MSRLLNFIVFKIRVYEVYFRHDILKVGMECIVMSTVQNMAEKMRAKMEWATTKTYICICLTSKYIIIIRYLRACTMYVYCSMDVMGTLLRRTPKLWLVYKFNKIYYISIYVYHNTTHIYLLYRQMKSV